MTEIRVPNTATVVDGDYGYWRSSTGSVRLERLAPGELDVQVMAGDTGLIASLSPDDAADLAAAINRLLSLE